MKILLIALAVAAFVIFELPVFGLIIGVVMAFAGNADTAQAVYLWCIDTQTAILGFQLWALR